MNGKSETSFSVLCGSTNFTENGPVYRHSMSYKSSKMFETRKIEYLKIFEFFFAGNNPAQTRNSSPHKIHAAQTPLLLPGYHLAPVVQI